MNVTCYGWNGYTWDGWWQGDEAQPTVFDNVHIRQNDRNSIRHGMSVSFDVPNGDDWSEEETGVDRYTMEAVEVDFYSGDYTLTGFVHVEKFGKQAEQQRERGVVSYAKQRWVVRRWSDVYMPCEDDR